MSKVCSLDCSNFGGSTGSTGSRGARPQEKCGLSAPKLGTPENSAGVPRVPSQRSWNPWNPCKFLMGSTFKSGKVADLQWLAWRGTPGTRGTPRIRTGETMPHGLLAVRELIAPLNEIAARAASASGSKR